MIGNIYVQLFPAHVGQMVLDGLNDHSASDVTALADKASAYERALDASLHGVTRRRRTRSTGPVPRNLERRHRPGRAGSVGRAGLHQAARPLRGPQSPLMTSGSTPRRCSSSSPEPGTPGLAWVERAGPGPGPGRGRHWETPPRSRPPAATSTADPVFADGVIGCSEFAGYTRILPGLLAKERLARSSPAAAWGHPELCLSLIHI